MNAIPAGAGQPRRQFNQSRLAEPAYRAGGLPPKFDSIVMSLDTAYKTGSTNDYSAAVVVGTLRGGPRDGFAPGHYVLDAWRGRVEFGQLKTRVVELQETWRANGVLVEDAASGQSLIQEEIRPHRFFLGALTSGFLPEQVHFFSKSVTLELLRFRHPLESAVSPQ